MGIISITEKAKEKIKTLTKESNFFRIALTSGGCAGYKYDFDVTNASSPEDIIIEGNILIDFRYSSIVQGSELDYIDDGFSSGFKFNKVDTSCGCGKSFSN